VSARIRPARANNSVLSVAAKGLLQGFSQALLASVCRKRLLPRRLLHR
jgi:hypothetical protein